MHCTSGNVIKKITDHLPNFLIIENLNTHLDSKVKPLKRELQHFTPEKLINEQLEHTQDTKKYKKYEIFHKSLVEVIDRNAPLEPMTKKEAKKQK